MLVLIINTDRKSNLSTNIKYVLLFIRFRTISYELSSNENDRAKEIQEELRVYAHAHVTHEIFNEF